jgi:hypothetical protein
MKSLSLGGTFGVLLFAFAAPEALRAEVPKILEFRVQEVNQKLYFHVRIERPADMLREERPQRRAWDPWNMDWTEPALRPRLVPQDGGARLVYTRERFEEGFNPRFGVKEKFDDRKGPPVPKEEKIDPDDPKHEKKKAFDEKKAFEDKKNFDDKKNFEDKKAFDEKKDLDDKKNGQGSADNALEFYGVFTGKKEATFLFLYPKDPGKEEDPGKLSLQQLLQHKSAWAEEKITLDPAAMPEQQTRPSLRQLLRRAKAKLVAAPKRGRNPDRPLDPNDLEGNWSFCQAQHFALLEGQTPEFGFYSYAREITSRRYKVRSPEPPWRPGMGERFDRGDGPGGETRRLYEVTTGAAAITESLALQRMRERGRNGAKQEPRTVPIAQVRGIDIDEHPWVKMMGDKKPAPEPLAKLVPHDNYYIHFKTITKFLETGDLLDEWGTSLARAYEVNSRDYRIKQKLEQQICLRSTGLARVFGPAVIKGLAITGNDPYLREGSDFSMIFQVANEYLFSAGTTPVLDQTKKKFGKDLRADREKYHGVTIESFVTPLREVSLHRASFDGYAVYSNSPAAVRRIIDAHQNKIKRLADSLDFQYMRTVFRADDPAEDGFIFLSDAFIRNLVGPAVRIKERRRLEALTSLHMVTNGAMYTAWETGKLPQSHDHVLAVTGMNPGELFAPDGNAIYWNAEQKAAVSSVYNTQHFATPLIEIPIDNVTQTEAREYEMFRLQYLGLWRQFFDPIGVRLSLKADQVKTEIYILPLVQTTQYNELRRIAGGGTIKLDPSVFSDKTLVQYLMHISPDVFGQAGFFGGFGDDLFVDLALRSWLGDWFTIRLDDSPIYAKLLESYIRSQMFPEERHDFIADLEMTLQVPLTIGFDVRSPMMFAGLLTGVRKMVENTLPGAIDWRPLDEPYKGVSIVRVKANGERIGRMIGDPEARRINPAFYYALIDGAFYLSLQEAPIRDLIDRSVALKGNKGDPNGRDKAGGDKNGGDKIELNSSLHLGPKAAIQAKPLLRMYLEWETHRRAQLNNRLLYALFRSNVAGPEDAAATVESAALQYLGFVPVSPDLAPFSYDVQREEVVNLRHGTLRQPKLNPGVEPKAPLGRLLEQFATIRADLRFREDGIHTTLTMRKNTGK